MKMHLKEIIVRHHVGLLAFVFALSIGIVLMGESYIVAIGILGSLSSVVGLGRELLWKGAEGRWSVRGRLKWITLSLILTAVCFVLLIGWLGPPKQEDIGALERQARGLFDSGDFSSAYTAYDRLARLMPGNLKYYRRIEESARKGGMKRSLLERYLDLVREEPKNSVFRNYLANAYLILDPIDKDGNARFHYEEAIRLDRRNKLPLGNLGILAARVGHLGEAESYLKKYCEAYPEDAQGWVNLGLLLIELVEKNIGRDRAVIESMASLEKAISIDPALPSGYGAIGRLSALIGDREKALIAYERSLALDFEQSDILNEFQTLVDDREMAAKSIAREDGFVTRGGANGSSRSLGQVLLYLEENRYEEVEKICHELLGQDPDSMLVLRLLSRALYGLGRDSEAASAESQIMNLVRGN